MPASLPPAGPEPTQLRNLDSLKPEAQLAATRFIIEAARQGIALRVTETLRTPGRQAWLWSIGRTNSHPASGSVVRLTNAPPGSSKHETGLAIDVVPMSVGDGPFKPTPIWSYPHWEMIGKIGEACGWSWGGRWQSPDRPHFELKG